MVQIGEKTKILLLMIMIEIEIKCQSEKVLLIDKIIDKIPETMVTESIQMNHKSFQIEKVKTTIIIKRI